MITIHVAADFSRTPGARYSKDGSFSGEEFREQFLEPHFGGGQDDEHITIVLDGVRGYPTSFLEEAFGGLARMYGKARVLKRLSFECTENPLVIEEIRHYIEHCDE